MTGTITDKAQRCLAILSDTFASTQRPIVQVLLQISMPAIVEFNYRTARVTLLIIFREGFYLQ